MAVKQALKQSKKFDEIYTPKYAIKPLLKYLSKDKIIWECTDFGNSNITRVLKENGFKVVNTHLKEGFDFLRDTPNFNYDIIVTNPPYSLKDKFLERAYELGKPFAFLLPITTFEGIKRGNMFRKHGIEVIVLDRRVQFLEYMGLKKGSGNWFNTSWFCWKLLPQQLIFEHLERN